MVCGRRRGSGMPTSKRSARLRSKKLKSLGLVEDSLSMAGILYINSLTPAQVMELRSSYGLLFDNGSQPNPIDKLKAMEILRCGKTANAGTRGMRKPKKKHAIRELVTKSKCSVACLQETKQGVMNQRLQKSICGPHFEGWVSKDASGTVGGLLICWNESMFEGNLINSGTYSPTVQLIYKSLVFNFMLSNIYGPHNHQEHHAFFIELSMLRETNAIPWILIGDFNATRFLSDRFNHLIRSWWEAESVPLDATTALIRKIRTIRSNLRSWNRNKVGNIIRKKNELLERIASLDSKEEMKTLLPSELDERTSLKSELEQVLTQEELLWKQCSHIQWLNNGDRNTRFFHLWASNRKRKNFIPELQFDDRIVTDLLEIQDCVHNFFMQLLGNSDHPWIKADWKKLFLKEPLAMHKLDAPFTKEKIKTAIFQIDSQSTPGPDGFSFAFTNTSAASSEQI
ncbi:uncharacterized protein [Elaeis guineensis]|uniref:uncharacterized protein n=1 Tax=Elaeis guineensis var. tenera TaxID=51953 RepID=UPI003C6D09FD